MTFPRKQFLLENQTVDIADPTPIEADGAIKTFAVWGSFGGGVVTLEGSPDGGATFIVMKKSDGSNSTFTSDSIEILDVMKNGMIIRATLSGSTGANVNAKLL